MATMFQALNQTTLSCSSFIGVPILTDANGDGIPRPRNIPLILFSATLYLDVLRRQYQRGRGYADDQISIYHWVEDRLSFEYGLDGRACVQRFICEMQKFPIRDWTIVGDILSSVFTPRQSRLNGMEDYRAAFSVGIDPQDSSCLLNYGQACPLSVFNFFGSDIF